MSTETHVGAIQIGLELGDRFKWEAPVLASVNRPNSGGIHGLEEAR